MKKLIFLSAFSLVVLFGCNKEETTPTSASLDVQNVEEPKFGLVMNLTDETPTWEYKELDMLEYSTDAVVGSRENSAHTHGDFVWEAAGLSLTWSGTQNNGGTHGSAVFETQTMLPDGTVTTIRATMETECITVVENRAVYGGIFTEVTGDPVLPTYFPWSRYYTVGCHMYFKVVDNGQGNNAPADQHGSTIILTRPSQSLCGIIPNTSNLVDVQAPGSVKIND